MSRPARTALLLAALLGAGCTSTTVAVIPDPLPEALPWTAPPSGGAFLGLAVEENDSGSLDDLHFDPGVRVTSVAPSTPAAGVGVRPGDVLLALDGHALDDPGALAGLLAALPAGREVRLQVRRDDTVFEVPVTLGGSEPAEPARALWQADRTRSLAGWATDAGGVRLVSLAPGSPLEAAGVPPGALVTAVDGREVLSSRALIRALEARPPGGRAELDWVPPGGGTPRRATLELPSERRVLTGFRLPVLVEWEASADGARSRFEFFDLWFLALLRRERDGGEVRWAVLTLFGYDVFTWSSGVGELAR